MNLKVLFLASRAGGLQRGELFLYPFDPPGDPFFGELHRGLEILDAFRMVHRQRAELFSALGGLGFLARPDERLQILDVLGVALFLGVLF